MEIIHVILLYQSITSFNIFQVTNKFTFFLYIPTVYLDTTKSLLPKSATYTHQQGHYQYIQPHHHRFNHTLINHIYFNKV